MPQHGIQCELSHQKGAGGQHRWRQLYPLYTRNSLKVFLKTADITAKRGAR